jgi:Family of unknown function (DUF5995)
MGGRTVGGSVLGVASGLGQANADGEPHDGPPAVETGLEGVLHALQALRPGSSGAPCAPVCCTWVCCTWVCCTWVCGAVVGDVHDRSLAAPGADPGLEFETVLVRRFGHRYLKVIADAAAGRPVPRTWQLLLDPPPAPPARRAVAGVGALLGYDLTLAFASTCTVLGRDPGSREREAHDRVAALLGARAGELVRRTGGPADAVAAARLDGPAHREAVRRRAESLWTLRGWPAEAEAERDALDRETHVATLRLLAGTG